jgi:arylsulfatase A-like enzyme
MPANTLLISLARALRFSCLIVAACSTWPSPSFADEENAATLRPNVLFIAIDDLRPELGCYGSRALTPNIDRLAASGLSFDRAYCNQAVCGASRVSLMTGLYPEFTGERTYHVTDWRKRWADVVTLNQHFTQSGYTTIGLGKIYHGSNGPGVDPENWTEWVKVRGREYANPESLKARKKNPRNRAGRNKGPSTEVSDAGDESHSDGNRAKVGASRLQQLVEAGKPFFLAVGFTKPHLPFVAPKKYWDLYDRRSFALPPNRGVPPGYPDWARNRNAGELRAYSDVAGKGTPAEFPDALNRRLLHGYHACVSYTDRNIGVLLDALESSGASKNTIVVLWADHGWKLGDHSSWCKHTNFECDTRVPLIIRDPRRASTRGRSKALVELIDLYPTLCDLSGLDKPEHLQGKSLLPVLENPAASHRDFAYSSYPHGRGKGQTGVVGHSIRTARHRYTEWWEKGTDKTVASTLTDVEADPGETTVVQGEAELRARLSKALRTRVLGARK